MPHSTQSRPQAQFLALLPILVGHALPGDPSAAQEVGQRFRDCPTCPVMVVVPAGSFMMGSAEGFPDERPPHLVTIESPFAVGVYEVTFAEWDACVDGGGCAGHRPNDMGWGRGRIPVTNVSWEDAWEYTAWLSQTTGETYRLLSEAEWEYVARAGTQTERYWGDDESEQCLHANGDDEEVSCSDGHEYGAPVGSFEANAFGLYDVLGNVWEWTEDCWNEDYVGAPVDGSAWRSGDCSQRVQRGGSLGQPPLMLRSAFRLGDSTRERYGWNGLRVARTLDEAGPAAAGPAGGDERRRTLADRTRAVGVPPGPICTGDYSPDPCWMEIVGRPGCYLWNPSPQDDETVTWNGECSRGLTQGIGRTTWYENHEVKQVWDARVADGKADGWALATYFEDEGRRRFAEGCFADDWWAVRIHGYERTLRSGYNWTLDFSFSAGEHVVINMKSDDFDSYLEVLRGDGTVLASNDDGGSGTDARLVYDVPTAGGYKIRAKGYEEDAAGSFVLWVGDRDPGTMNPGEACGPG